MCAVFLWFARISGVLSVHLYLLQEHHNQSLNYFFDIIIHTMFEHSSLNCRFTKMDKMLYKISHMHSEKLLNCPCFRKQILCLCFYVNVTILKANLFHQQALHFCECFQCGFLTCRSMSVVMLIELILWNFVSMKLLHLFSVEDLGKWCVRASVRAINQSPDSS